MKIFSSEDDMVFVFGSNEAGIHGAGAAKEAVRKYGALYGKGAGFSGNSYAIPTKDRNIDSLSIPEISHYVQEFIKFANLSLTMKFKVTAVGCGLAGFTNAQMAPLFSAAPLNCWFDTAWEPYLGKKFHYWGTFGEATMFTRRGGK